MDGQAKIREAKMPTATERAFAQKMESEGWEVYRNGFPDFLCVKDGKVIFVEVKRSKSEQPRANQYQILQLLNGTMIDAFLWSPDSSDLVPLKKVSRSMIQNRQIALPIKVAKPDRRAETHHSIGWFKHLEKIKKVKDMHLNGEDFWIEYNRL